MKRDRRPKAVLLLFALLVGLLVAGCKDTPSATGVKWEIERQIPGVQLEREFHLRLGRFSMAFLRKIALWALDEDDEDDRQARAILSGVRRLDVATYRVRSLPEPEKLDGPYRFERRLAENGWTMVVRVRDEDERTWVFTREDERGALRNLYVVALDDSELTVVDLQGRLDRMLAAAVADDPAELAEILGS